jgi:hypothetical protein
VGDVVGVGVGDVVGVGVGETVGVGVGETVGVGESETVGDTLGDWPALGLPLGLALSLGVDEALRVGEGLGSDADGEPEQAATAMQAINATTPKPATLSRARVLVACVFIEPPGASGRSRRPFVKCRFHHRHAHVRHRHAMAGSSFEYWPGRVEPHSRKKGRTAALRQKEWRRIAGLRVVMSWPESSFAPPPRGPAGQAPGGLRGRVAGMVGLFLIIGGAAAMIVALRSQHHAPQPSAGAAGAAGPSAVRPKGPWLQRSTPTSIAIPAIGVNSGLLRLGISTDGAMQVPSLPAQADDAAWYEYSATPGQVGVSVIEGHVDSYDGPAVFFRLGALRPGDRINVRLADGITAVFRVSGVREYPKSRFPASAVYGSGNYAGLRLITCGGAFDYATGHYLSSIVVFASLASS